MTVLKFLTALFLYVTSAFLFSGCNLGNDSADNDKKVESGNPKIYLITMDKKSPYWSELDEGCRQAVSEIGNIDYQWLASAERDITQQGECIDQAVAEGAKAILISPVSEKQLNPNLEAADKAGVKIIYVDSAANYPGVATLMTDNRNAGKTAGEIMLKALQEKGVRSGMIGVMANTPISLNTELRLKGFRDVFEGTDFVLAPDFFANGNRQAAMFTLKGRANYVGFFGADQTSTIFIGDQTDDSMANSVIVGFDTAEPTVALVKSGNIYATIKQNAQTMGHDGVEIALKAIKGEMENKNVVIDTGVTIITKDNVNLLDN